MISALLLLSVGVLVLPLLFMAYHINRQPKRLPLTNERVRAPKPPNVRPEDLPRAPTVKGYLRVQPTIEEQDKIDWDERFKTWQAQQKKTIDADDPELYEILEKAATRRQLL